MLVPIAAKPPQADAVDGASGITQYRIRSTEPLEIHGFAGSDSAAGRAARTQGIDFVTTIWTTGRPKITVPAGCTGGSCDFSGVQP